MESAQELKYSGINDEEASKKLLESGPNEIAGKDDRGLLKILAEVLKEPMVLLLTGIGVIYLSLGEYEEFYSLLSFLALILGITIVQEKKTENTLKALKDISSPRAVVIRNGKQKRIPGRDLVPDDIVILNEGDRVPADITILKGGPLSLDESLITGESYSVNKNIEDKILSGTLVLKGQALGLVTATGVKTELGKIGTSLKETEKNKTQLEIATNKIVKKLSLLVAALTLFIVLYYWYTQKNLLESILTGLTLAMAILPNELPAVLLIFLAAGAWRISQKNVLTRKIPAVEALGGVTYLCVDKTGTLTQNKMTVKELWNGKETILIQEKKNELPEEFHEILEFGILASPPNPFDPLEKSIHTAGKNLLQHTEHLHPEWSLSREYQITTELLAVSFAWKERATKDFIIGAKGATEAIIDLCHLAADKATLIENQMLVMASQGLRVIAVAKSTSKTLPEKQHDLDYEFIGLVGFEDPVRTDAKNAVLECQKAGIKIIMITGDHPNTAMNIAKQVGLHNSESALTGQEIHLMNDEDLQAALKKTQIFCRMKPLDKLRIVTLLQKSNEVVAMTGDGVNDAPALKKADIGIAMGERGTDVAREAASIVLLDDNFSSIVSAIKTGRRTFSNLQEAFLYLMTIHIPIAALTIFPVLFKLPMVLLPIHIAFIHLIIEPASTTIFEAIPSDENSMNLPPRKINSPIVQSSQLISSVLQGLFISFILVGVFLFTLKHGHVPTDARGITFATLVVSNLFLIFIYCSNKDRLFKILTLATLVLLACVVYVPFFRELFRFEILHVQDLVLCLAGSLIAAVGVKLIRTFLSKT